MEGKARLLQVHHGAIAVTVDGQPELSQRLTASPQSQKKTRFVMIQHAEGLKNLVCLVMLAGVILIETQGIELLEGIGRYIVEHGEGATILQEGLYRLLIHLGHVVFHYCS